MEYGLLEFLTREEILYRLKRRHLKMSDLERLSQRELLRIYKTFVVPMARREPLHERDDDQQPAKEKPIPMELDMTSTSQSNTIITTNTATHDQSYGVKRPHPHSCERHNLQACHLQQPSTWPLNEKYLSNATKRMKININ